MLWDEPKIFFLERRYFFSIILSEFLKNRVALQKGLCAWILMLLLVINLASCGGEKKHTYTEEEQRVYQMVIRGYNMLCDSLYDPSSVKVYGIRLYDEELVVFRITATNGFGGTVTDYVGYDGYTVHFEYQNFYSGNDILWEDVLAYNDTLKSETD